MQWKTFMPLGCLLAAMFIAGTVVAQDAQPLTVLENKAVGLKFSYPGVWEVKKNEAANEFTPLYVQLLIIKDHKTVGGVGIVVQKNNEDLTVAAGIAERVEVYLSGIKKKGKVTVDIDKAAKVGGAPGNYLHYVTVDPDGDKHQTTVYFTAHGNYGYMFSYSADSADFDDKPFEVLINSVSWLAN